MSIYNKNILSFISPNYFTLYQYQRILYYISQYAKRGFNLQANNILGKVVDLLVTNFHLKFDHNFLSLYCYIIEKYYIYMSDLLCLADMNTIINNKYKLTKCAHFFRLPSRVDIDHKYDRYKDILDINKDIVYGHMNLKLILNSDNFDISDISSVISYKINNILYSNKEDYNKKFSQSEKEYISKFINSQFNCSDKDTIRLRTNALYIWDCIHLYNSNKSVANLAGMLNGIKKNESTPPQMARAYQRYYKATQDCIECCDFKPLIPKK